MNKRVLIVFSSSKKIGSKVIRYGSVKMGESYEDVPSHFSYVFFDMFVLESRLESGVDVNVYSEFMKANKIHAIYDLGVSKAGPMFMDFFKKTNKKPYDWGAVLFLAWEQVKWKFFGKKKAKKNKWNNKDKYYCNELFSLIEEGDYSMVTPYELMKLIDGKYEKVQ